MTFSWLKRYEIDLPLTNLEISIVFDWKLGRGKMYRIGISKVVDKTKL